jgi:hypothetical protein
MKPETQALLYQCRTALLQRPDEQVAALLQSWFECMIGDEDLDETLDDLCLLLDYRVSSEGAETSYDTYTSWWEVEGEGGENSGEFRCADVGSLRLRLLDMSAKEFDMLCEVAYQARTFENERSLPTGHAALREFFTWLENEAPGSQLTDQETAQPRLTPQEAVEQACQQGYLLITPTINEKISEEFRIWCKHHDQPHIWVERMGPYLRRIYVDTNTLDKRDPHEVYPQLDERLKELITPYLTRDRAAHNQAQFYWITRKRFALEWVPEAEVGKLVHELIDLWIQLSVDARQLAAQREAARLAALEPLWSRKLKRWQTPEQPPELPPLAEAIILPPTWDELFTREELSAFLAYLGQPVRSRDAKATLVQSVQERLESDPVIRAQFFELFKCELAVPPWELETLLACTLTERKRWTEEGRLPILDQRTFRKGGANRVYPVFDRRIILSLTPTDLAQWRAEHQERVKERRKVAAAKRKEQQQPVVQAANTSGSSPR